MIAPAGAYGFGVFEVSARKATAMGNQLEIRISASLPFQVARFVSTKLARPSEEILHLLATDDAAAGLLQES
ncbi:MAG: hypothetical protein WB643_13095 [Candidatus Bathyarchaeia archaeon]